MCEQGTSSRSFLLHIRCYGCQKLSSQELPIPNETDAPTSIDELMESQIMQSLAFRCKRCEGAIGSVVAVNMREWQETAA